MAQIIIICLLLVLSGCGGGDAGTGVSLPVIIQAPMSAAVPLGASWTFSVVASGSNLNYTWYKNGASLNDSNTSKYQIAPVSAADAGAQYYVLVSNTAGAIQSSKAVLTIGARAPGAGDLRFRSVDAPYILSGMSGVVSTNLISDASESYSDVVASPLQLGTGLCSGSAPVSCDWFYSISQTLGTATSPNSSYVSGLRGGLQSEITALDGLQNVISSLDIEDSAGFFALKVDSLPGISGFYVNQIDISASLIAQTISNEAINGRIVTALSGTNGQIECLSYGWTGNGSQVYTTSVSHSSLTSLVADATTLALGGYIITALGNDGLGGLYLVGSKVAGDAEPREILFAQYGGGVPDTSGNLSTMAAGGYAIVGSTFNETTGTSTVIGER